MVTKSTKKIGIPEVASRLGVKYQVARDLVLEGTFGRAEKNAAGQWEVDRTKVNAYANGTVPKSKG